MTFFVTAESFALAVAAASLRLSVPGAGPLSRAFQNLSAASEGLAGPTVLVRDDILDPTARTDAQRHPPSADVVAFLHVGVDAGDVFAVDPAAWAALAPSDPFRQGPGEQSAAILVRTGRLMVGREARQYLLVCRSQPQTQRLCALLGSYDPKHRPHLIGATVDLAQPLAGANLYPNELSRGAHMRWQGPDPVLRIAIERPLRRLLAGGANHARLELTVALVYDPAPFAGLALYLGDRPISFVVTEVGGMMRIVTFLQREWIEDALAASDGDGGAELVACVPFTLKETTPRTTPGDSAGRFLSFALAGIDLTGFYTGAHLPPLNGRMAPVPVDRIATALEALSGRLHGAAPPLRALTLQDDGPGGRHASARNAVLGGELLHLLTLERTGETTFSGCVEGTQRAVTKAGYAHLVRCVPQVFGGVFHEGALHIRDAPAATPPAIEALWRRLSP